MPRLTAAALAGIAMGLCLPKPGLCVFAWLAPAIFFAGLQRARTRFEAARLSGAFGFFFCGFSLSWIYETCRFAGVPILISAAALLCLAGFLSLNWIFYGITVQGASGSIPFFALPWVYAVLWTALESASARWTPRIGVDVLAYTQYQNTSLIQIGSVFGPHGLGFLIILWNASLANIFHAPKSRAALGNAAAAGVLLLSAFFWGRSELAKRPADLSEQGRYAVEILQPNIDQYRKWDESFESEIRTDIDSLLARPRAAAGALAVWPESALPGWLDESANFSWVSGWAKRLDAPMLVGTVSRSDEKRRNSAVLMRPDGSIESVYHKRRLVPFGEFVPLRPLLEPWIGILSQMGDFDPGEPRQPLLSLPFGVSAVTICYEAVFPLLSQDDSKRGARVFFNLTNDGWYKDTAGPRQHFYTNVFRAIENRAMVIRAANTGISGVIDPWGVVLAETRIGVKTRLDVLIPENPFQNGSFYSRHGDWFGALAIAVSCALFVWTIFRRRTKLG